VLRYPAFVAEMGRGERRRKLWQGVGTGYATAALFAVLAWLAQGQGVLPPGNALYALLVLKLAANTATALALRVRTLELEASAANTLADILLMTGAIYLTGGQQSPLVPIYFVETTVIALLANTGLTLLVTVVSWASYAAMALLTYGGALRQQAPPSGAVAELGLAYVVLDLIFVGVVLLGPATYVALIVQRLREKEAALAERARDLVEAARQKTQFMANVTHELRTPIHGVLGVADVMEEGIYGPLTDAQREALGNVRASARGLLEMVDALLLLARAEAVKLELHVTPVDVAEVVTSVAATARFLAAKRPLTVRAEVDGALPQVRTDRAKLVQILVNLLANAVKFTPDGGAVTVRAGPGPDGGARIEVSDTGPGIPAAEIPRIWEAFRQVDGSASRTYGGAGLGLAVVRELAASVEAKVLVDSTVGAGSTFAVLLPAEIAAPPLQGARRRVSASELARVARGDVSA
jgi:signal transduction histidine kinase